MQKNLHGTLWKDGMCGSDSRWVQNNAAGLLPSSSETWGGEEAWCFYSICNLAEDFLKSLWLGPGKYTLIFKEKIILITFKRNFLKSLMQFLVSLKQIYTLWFILLKQIIFCFYIFLSLSIYASNLYTHHWAWTHDPQIKSCMLFQQSQPGDLQIIF